MASQIRQFQTARGDLPVEEYLHSLRPKERAVTLRHVQLLSELGRRLREPHVKRIVDHQRALYELRPGGHRIFYCMREGETVVLLHAYRQQSNRTPARELATAKRRYDRVMGGAGTAGFGGER